jgi:seryl-tRNA synthetase
MTAESLVLAYWGYGTDYNPNNLSQDQQYNLKNTVLLMHEWENIKTKKVKADAAAYEIQIAALQNKESAAIQRIAEAHDENIEQEKEIEKLKREVIGMDGEIQHLNARLATALTTIAALTPPSPAPQQEVSTPEVEAQPSPTVQEPSTEQADSRNQWVKGLYVIIDHLDACRVKYPQSEADLYWIQMQIFKLMDSTEHKKEGGGQ